MKRFVVIAVTVGLIAGALAAAPAQAKKKKPKRTTRTEEGVYNGGAGVATLYAINFGGARWDTATTEHYVTVELTDMTGQTVGFDLGQDPDGDSQAAIIGSGCGKTTIPVPIQGGVPVIVFVGSLTACGDPAPAFKGTIKITFSNIP